MDQQTFTRQELYDLVWTTPLLTLSKQYAISDVGLRKTCVRMQIPLPRAGHWQQLRFGKKIPKAPLPSDYKGEKEVRLALRGSGSEMPPRGHSPAKILKHAIEEDTTLRLKVPEKLINPDPLIAQVKKSLVDQKPDSYTYLGPVHSYRDELDIRVGRELVARALRFMDTLIKVLKARGHEVVIRNGNSYAILEGLDFKIQLREKTQKEVVKDKFWDRTVFKPTGVLAFQVKGYYSHEWKDGKVVLEEQLSSILAYLEIRSQEWKAIREKHKREEEERQVRIRQHQANEKRKEDELAAFKDMLAKAERWHKAENLRSYIREVERKALLKGGLTQEVGEWIEWAEKKADWYDPFVEGEDAFMGEVDRDRLEMPKRAAYYGW